MAKDPRIVLANKLSSECNSKRVLNFMLICCEEDQPYGPAEETAKMFLELLALSYERLSSLNEDADSKTAVSSISITVYHAQHQDYPKSKEEWDTYHGILIPGSLSSAYDTHITWIERLHQVIRDEIHANQRKTLAVCFGHQSFAHALGDLHVLYDNDDGSCRLGEAIQCPTGSKAGRKSFILTPVGSNLLTNFALDSGERCMEMLYTHGDMVSTLPSTGLSLGGNSEVPVQAAAYFACEESALKFKQFAELSQGNKYNSEELPYAFTFQAHPEFTTPSGGTTFMNILHKMAARKHIDSAQAKEASNDAQKNVDKVKADSLDAIETVGVILGWFQ